VNFKLWAENTSDGKSNIGLKTSKFPLNFFNGNHLFGQVIWNEVLTVKLRAHFDYLKASLKCTGKVFSFKSWFGIGGTYGFFRFSDDGCDTAGIVIKLPFADFIWRGKEHDSRIETLLRWEWRYQNMGLSFSVIDMKEDVTIGWGWERDGVKARMTLGSGKFAGELNYQDCRFTIAYNEANQNPFSLYVQF
jgi:hypothetical protein